MAEQKSRLDHQGNVRLGPVGEKIAYPTRIVYGWLQGIGLSLDEDEVMAKVCLLKGEARADAPGEEAKLLGRSLQEYVDEMCSSDPDTENTLVYHMFRWALGQVQWQEMAKWILRDDKTWPATEVGPSETEEGP